LKVLQQDLSDFDDNAWKITRIGEVTSKMADLSESEDSGTKP
jgi:hypothetical protein